MFHVMPNPSRIRWYLTLNFILWPEKCRCLLVNASILVVLVDHLLQLASPGAESPGQVVDAPIDSDADALGCFQALSPAGDFQVLDAFCRPYQNIAIVGLAGSRLLVFRVLLV